MDRSTIECNSCYWITADNRYFIQKGRQNMSKEKCFTIAFREVIEAAYPTPNSTKDNTIVKMLCDWGRQSCDELDKISRQRDLLLKVVKGVRLELNLLFTIAKHQNHTTAKHVSDTINRVNAAIAEVEK